MANKTTGVVLLVIAALAILLVAGNFQSFVPTLPSEDSVATYSFEGTHQVQYGQPLDLTLRFTKKDNVAYPTGIDYQGGYPYCRCGVCGYFAFISSIDINSMRIFVDGVDYTYTHRKYQIVPYEANLLVSGSNPTNNPSYYPAGSSRFYWKQFQGISSGNGMRQQVNPDMAYWDFFDLIVPQYLPAGNHSVCLVFQGGTGSPEQSDNARLLCPNNIGSIDTARSTAASYVYPGYPPGNTEMYNRQTCFDFEVLPTETPISCSGTLNGTTCTTSVASILAPYTGMGELPISGCPIGTGGGAFFGGQCQYSIIGTNGSGAQVAELQEQLALLQAENEQLRANASQMQASLNAVLVALNATNTQLLATSTLLNQTLAQLNTSLYLNDQYLANLSAYRADLEAYRAQLDFVNAQMLQMQVQLNASQDANANFLAQNEILLSLNYNLTAQNDLYRLSLNNYHDLLNTIAGIAINSGSLSQGDIQAIQTLQIEAEYWRNVTDQQSQNLSGAYALAEQYRQEAIAAQANAENLAEQIAALQIQINAAAADSLEREALLLQQELLLNQLSDQLQASYDATQAANAQLAIAQAAEAAATAQLEEYARNLQEQGDLLGGAQGQANILLIAVVILVGYILITGRKKR